MQLVHLSIRVREELLHLTTTSDRLLGVTIHDDPLSSVVCDLPLKAGGPDFDLLDASATNCSKNITLRRRPSRREPFDDRKTA